MGFDPYREEEQPDRFDHVVAVVVIVVVVAMLAWALI